MIYKKTWKYILCKDNTNYCTKHKYFRIKSLKNFHNVRKGEIGGLVRNYHNLSQEGGCWIYDDARVKDNAKISEDAHITDTAIISDNVQISGFTVIGGDVVVYGDKIITKGTYV